LRHKRSSSAGEWRSIYPRRERHPCPLATLDEWLAAVVSLVMERVVHLVFIVVVVVVGVPLLEERGVRGSRRDQLERRLLPALLVDIEPARRMLFGAPQQGKQTILIVRVEDGRRLVASPQPPAPRLSRGLGPRTLLGEVDRPGSFR